MKYSNFDLVGEGMLCAEASTLDFEPANDIFITFPSNTVIRFNLEKIDIDADGDVIRWIYVPLDAPEIDITTLVIFND